MTKLERAVANCLVETLNDKLVDGIDRGEWLLTIGDKEFVVEYLAGKVGHPGTWSNTMTLSVPDKSNDDYKVKHRFVISIEAQEVLK